MSMPTLSEPGQLALDERHAGSGRAGRRLVKALSGLLRRLRSEGERIITITEGVEAVSWRKRVVLGSTWPFCHRVALVFTDRRLLEVALSPWGRRISGLVRELSWSSSPQPRFDQRTLIIAEAARWWMRRPLPKALVNEIVQISKSEKAKAGRTGTSLPWRLCPQCGVTVTTAGARCRRCGSLWRSRRLAGLLAVAFPGAGMMMLGRPFFAFVRIVLELACLGLVADQLLKADSAARTAAVVALGVVLAVLLKTESIRMARALTNRSGIMSEAAARRWRLFIPVGMLISLIAAGTPLLLRGSAGTAITAELAAEASHLGWSVERTAEQPDGTADDVTDDAADGTTSSTATGDPVLRAVWRNAQEGLEVQARALPFNAFESTDEARGRWIAAYQARHPSELGQKQLGTHDVIRVVEALGDGEAPPRVRLELLLLDRRGRDAHTLVTEVPEARLPEADAALQQLVRCMYWIDAG